jgi:transposase
MSMAAVALAHGLNANLLRRWVVDAQQRPQPPLPTPVRETATTLPSFVALPLPVPSSTATPTPADPIRIELARGDATVHVQWPLSATAQCAAWLRELL